MYQFVISNPSDVFAFIVSNVMVPRGPDCCAEKRYDPNAFYNRITYSRTVTDDDDDDSNSNNKINSNNNNIAAEWGCNIVQQNARPRELELDLVIMRCNCDGAADRSDRQVTLRAIRQTYDAVLPPGESLPVARQTYRMCTTVRTCLVSCDVSPYLSNSFGCKRTSLCNSITILLHRYNSIFTRCSFDTHWLRVTTMLIVTVFDTADEITAITQR